MKVTVEVSPKVTDVTFTAICDIDVARAILKKFESYRDERAIGGVILESGKMLLVSGETATGELDEFMIPFDEILSIGIIGMKERPKPKRIEAIKPSKRSLWQRILFCWHSYWEHPKYHPF